MIQKLVPQKTFQYPFNSFEGIDSPSRQGWTVAITKNFTAP